MNLTKEKTYEFLIELLMHDQGRDILQLASVAEEIMKKGQKEDFKKKLAYVSKMSQKIGRIDAEHHPRAKRRKDLFFHKVGKRKADHGEVSGRADRKAVSFLFSRHGAGGLQHRQGLEALHQRI